MQLDGFEYFFLSTAKLISVKSDVYIVMPLSKRNEQPEAKWERGKIRDECIKQIIACHIRQCERRDIVQCINE